LADRPEAALVSGNLGHYNNKSPANRQIMELAEVNTRFAPVAGGHMSLDDEK
jgi:hypothetical protein